MRRALELLPLSRAEVWVVSVTDPEERIGANEDAQDDLARATQLLASAGVQSTALMRRGHFAEQIVEAARELSVDVIVVGSSGHGALYEWVTRGVTTEVIQRWRGAVLVVGPA